jgi:hypothetical protein
LSNNEACFITAFDELAADKLILAAMHAALDGITQKHAD